MTRRTKIVATIGPATDHPEVLAALIDAGMDTARVSLSHGPVEDSLDRIARVRTAADASGHHIGILADLPGPKIRAAEFGGDTRLNQGAELDLVPSEPGAVSIESRVAVDHDSLLDEIQAGDRVGLGDGAVQLEVVQVDGDRARVRVLTGGTVRGRPGVILPPGRLSLTSPTERDLDLLDQVVAAGVDAVAISFVRTGEDIEVARRAQPDAMLVAKIETPEAVDALPGIIATADGVMVARGDLGLRCPPEDVPHHQKRIIRTGVAFGRPVITATQMLESMIRASTPTRAEVTDIANAVFDGTSALMLSAETAIGRYPVEAVATMARIAARAEREFDYVGWGHNLGRLQSTEARPVTAAAQITAAVSAAAWRASAEAEVSAIIACTNTGTTARAISRFRPTMPVIAATPSNRTAQQLSMAWGITPMVTGMHSTTDEVVWFAVEAAVTNGYVRSGQLVAVLVGSPQEPGTPTDTLRMVRVH